MPKTQVISPKLRQPSGHFSHATMVAARGRFVFISGMTARCADGTIAGVGDIEVQTRQVCENVKAAVEEAGGTMDDICRVDVYVRTWSILISFTKCGATISGLRRPLRPWSKSPR
jgi:enamine deaminase RidA (YjgF/YER057c/UK114 family)